MDQPAAEAMVPRQHERWQALVDILYLTQLTWLYVFAAIYPFFGLFYGILLISGSISPRAKRVGRVCLILGIINLALAIVAVIAFVALGLSGLWAGLMNE